MRSLDSNRAMDGSERQQAATSRELNPRAGDLTYPIDMWHVSLVTDKTMVRRRIYLARSAREAQQIERECGLFYMSVW